PVGRYLLNSFIVPTAVVIGQLITASLAAYAFSFLGFRRRQVLFFLFLSTLMIPWEATIIPNYMTIRTLGWLDTYQGLAVPFMATAFGTFLLRQAFMQIPRELWDAARIDGSTTFRFLREVVIPLARPALRRRWRCQSDRGPERPRTGQGRQDRREHHVVARDVRHQRRGAQQNRQQLQREPERDQGHDRLPGDV